MDEQGRPIPPHPLRGMVDPISSCLRREAHIVQTPLPNYENNDLEWCLSSYIAVNGEFQQSPAVPELYTQRYVMVVSLPMGGACR